MTHRRVFDAEGSHFINENIHSSFWEAQADYKRRYFRVTEPTSSTQNANPLPPEKESTFFYRRRKTLTGTLIGVAILFYSVRFAGYLCCQKYLQSRVLIQVSFLLQFRIQARFQSWQHWQLSGYYRPIVRPQ